MKINRSSGTGIIVAFLFIVVLGVVGWVKYIKLVDRVQNNLIFHLNSTADYVDSIDFNGNKDRLEYSLDKLRTKVEIVEMILPTVQNYCNLGYDEIRVINSMWCFYSFFKVDISSIQHDLERRDLLSEKEVKDFKTITLMFDEFQYKNYNKWDLYMENWMPIITSYYEEYPDNMFLQNYYSHFSTSRYSKQQTYK